MIRRCLLVLTMLVLMASSAPAQPPLTLINVRGRYTSTFLGVQSGGSSSSRNLPVAESGALISDGKGTLMGFLNFDFDGSTVAICSISGTYTVGTDPVGGVDGLVKLNLQFPTCENVSCPGTPPECTTGTTFTGLPEEEWCALSGTSGSVLDCTLMGEIGFPNSPNTQTLIFPVHWERHE